MDTDGIKSQKAMNRSRGLLCSGRPARFIQSIALKWRAGGQKEERKTIINSHWPRHPFVRLSLHVIWVESMEIQIPAN